VLLNDLEFDGDPLRVSNMDTSNTLGTVKLNDGTFTYDSSVAFADLDEGETGVETFSCTISDGKGGAGTATR
jgi:VCBS repeat-containing protein